MTAPGTINPAMMVISAVTDTKIYDGDVTSSQNRRFRWTRSRLASCTTMTALPI